MFSAFSRRRFQLRRVVSLATTFALIACTLGFPIPTAKLEKDTSTPYPCMDCGCGCASAEMCWKSCCCYSQQEKLAWARKKGISPPQHVVAAARLEQLAAMHTKVDACCETKKPSCCSTAKSCCESKVASCCETPSSVPQNKDSIDSQTLVMFKVLQCRGLNAQWVFAPIFLPVDAGTPSLELLPFETVVSLEFSYPSHTTKPTTPPPQFS